MGESIVEAGVSGPADGMLSLAETCEAKTTLAPNRCRAIARLKRSQRPADAHGGSNVLSGRFSLPLVREQPLVEIGVRVRLRPRVVREPRSNREPHVLNSKVFQRFDHALAFD